MTFEDGEGECGADAREHDAEQLMNETDWDMNLNHEKFDTELVEVKR